MKKFSHILLFWLLTVCCTSTGFAKSITVASPAGYLEMTLSGHDTLRISLSYQGKPLLLPSPIALDIMGENKGQSVKSYRVKKDIADHISSPFHHTAEYDITYNEVNIVLSGNQRLTFRIFNDGVAYRFGLTGKKERVILSETADYRLAGNPKLFLSHSTNKNDFGAMAFQNYYAVTPASSASPYPAFLPATVDYGDGLKLSLMESDVEAYPGMFISADSITGTLKAIFSKYPSKTAFKPKRMQEYVVERENFIAKVKGDAELPWRILAVTTSYTQMPVNNLVYTLASPSRVTDTSWIKPGKAAWEWWNDWGLRGVPFEAGINNDTYKYFIDFAADNGIEYVVLDEGWYVPSSGDMLVTIPEIDLPMLVEYARSKGVGLWLWTVFNVLDSQLEEACKKYSEMGIKGLKVDFLDRNDQPAAEMTYRIAEAAARNNLLLDLHGFYTPTGLNRTYPNILNFESVFGMEEMKWSPASVDMPEYDVTFPFIRMMAGPVDFTPGAMNNASKGNWKAIYSSPMSQGTRCHQIANYIIQDSPFTMLADTPSNYLANQECTDFITSLPTVFTSTKVLDGEMGEYIVTLRETPDAWYIAGQTDWNARDYTLRFDFLPVGKKYDLVLFEDGMNAAKQARDYAVEKDSVDSRSIKEIRLAPGGGFAAKIIK